MLIFQKNFNDESGEVFYTKRGPLTFDSADNSEDRVSSNSSKPLSGRKNISQSNRVEVPSSRQDHGNDPRDIVDGAVSKFNEWQGKREREAEYASGAKEYFKGVVGKKPHELTATYASDPSKKEEMIRANEKHTKDEEGRKLVESAKSFNPGEWFKTVTSNDKVEGKEQPVAEQNTSTSEKVVAKTSTPTQPKTNPKSQTPEPATTVEEPTIQPESDKTREGLSNGAKTGLAVAGAAALTAGGFAAYKALKKRQAKKKAEQEEVDRFLREKYNTNN